AFDLSFKHWYNSKIPNIDLGKDGKEYEIKHWQKKALHYFLDTQYSFASVIEADKRDAGKLGFFNYENSLLENIIQISSSLDVQFSKFAQSESISELNKVRTEIRKEAVASLPKLLASKQRVFTLTAPTGAGKTFTLIDIARAIQKEKGELGIIFALPFLSITEQVQDIIANDLHMDVLAVNSKSFNERIDKSQKEYETEQSAENLKALLVEDFIENTFDHPFIITTFVQLFETLLSNRNSTLLKLPNFSNRIFLIDEVQALPPRLYIFFSAWLDAFCKMNNSYSVLSTATMPNLSIPEKTELQSIKTFELKNPKTLFKDYVCPEDLLNPKKFFDYNVFNRYIISVIEKDQTIESLKTRLLAEEKSILVILNTIQDTKDLFYELSDLPNVFLLNTHFAPEDRLSKIEYVKRLLRNEKVVLISTQLIEAGVDIDFPVVYRDLCPLPSLIQSAGRCNRNKNLDFGEVYLFQLVNAKGKYSSELIYRNEAKLFLDFLRTEIKGTIQEKELFDIQRRFFDSIAKDLVIGEYPEEKMNLIEEINKAQFQSVGRFQLINNKIFGKQFQFYVPGEPDDYSFEELQEIVETISDKNYEKSKSLKIKINMHLKKMSNRIVTVRVFDESLLPKRMNSKEVCGINKLDINYYSKIEGIKFQKKSYVML
ncbi:MAG: CRISPR-associated helicase Cas3', partial [bacterium]